MNYTEEIQQSASNRDITIQDISQFVDEGFNIIEIANPLNTEQFAGKEGQF